jgi:enhancing lycopene biosynthesis protein 2
VLIVLACLLAPLGALSTWAMYGLGDSGRYEATMAPLAADADVRDAIAAGVTDGIMREVHVRPRMQGPVNHFVRDAVRSFTQTPAYRTAWEAANAATHDAVMRALRDDRVGAVTVDLAPITEQVKRQLADDHMPLADRIPVEHTEITVLEAEDLTQLRKGFHVLEVAGFWLPVAAVVFALAGILVAVCRRRAVLATGLGTALGAALLGVAVAVGRRLTLADLPPDVSPTAAGAVYDALTSTLRLVSWSLLALGAAVAVAALLTGAYARYRRASAARSQAPAERARRVRA